MKKVSILLSVYNPNKEFLIKQLKSLDSQTYKNTEILVFDDCPRKRSNKELFFKYVKKFDIRILEYNNKNVGYSSAFKILLEQVNHDGYVAFCDQDDIWLDTKVEEMVNSLEKNNKEFAYCDRKIIDEKDNIIKEHEVNDLIQDFKEDYNKLLVGSPFRTLVPGMSIICSVKFAKSCFDGFDRYAFDKWLSCCALVENNYVHVNKELVMYRRHSNNVSGIFNEINSKKEYFEKRVSNHYELIGDLSKKYPNGNFKIQKEFALDRVNKKILKMFKYRWISKRNTLIEILIILMPNFLFKYLLKKYRKE